MSHPNLNTHASTDPAPGAGAPAMPEAPKRLNFFERYLSLWVLACMVVGVGLGKLLPGFVAALSRSNSARGRRSISPSRCSSG